MIQLEIFSRATIHTTRPITPIDCIDYLARNRWALRLIPEQLAGIDKFQTDLLFKLAPALLFLQLRSYLGLFAFRCPFLFRSLASRALGFPTFTFSPLFFQKLLIPALSFLMLEFVLTPELRRTLLFLAFFLRLFLFQALQHTTGAKPSPDAPDAPQEKDSRKETPHFNKSLKNF